MATSKGTKDSGWQPVSNDVPKPQPTAAPVERTSATPGAKPGALTDTEIGNRRGNGDE